MANPPQKIQCKARSKRSGEQCKKYAQPGALVCEKHGVGNVSREDNTQGRRSRVRLEDADRIIRERLLELREPAVAALESILRDDMGNARPSDQIRAAEVVLDRLIPKKVEAKVDTVDSEERDLDAEIAGTLGIELDVPHEVSEEEAG